MAISMAGRKRKPTALKLIQGTAQKCRLNPNEPKPDASPLRVTLWLTDKLERKYFMILKGRLEKIGQDSSTFTEMVSLAAQRMAEIYRYKKRIQEEGDDYVSKRVFDKQGRVTQELRKPHPLTVPKNDAQRHLEGLLKNMGLSQADISKVSKLDLGKKGNKFGDL